MEPLPPKSDTEQAQPERGASDAKEEKIETLIAALVKINQSNRKADNAEHQRTYRREKVTFWLHIAEIILITVYAFFTILEWHTFDSERVTMEDELKTSQAAASAQLNAIVSQNKQMQKSSEADERAWISIGKIFNFFTADLPGVTPTDVSFRVSFKNTGKTPAINVVPLVNHYTNINSIPKYDKFPNPVYSSSMMSAGSDVDSGMTTSVLPPIYGSLYEAIKSGNPYFIAGTVWYDDIFGRHHWTQFCYGVSPDFTFTTPPIHNSCDDVKTNQSN